MANRYFWHFDRFLKQLGFKDLANVHQRRSKVDQFFLLEIRLVRNIKIFVLLRYSKYSISTFLNAKLNPKQVKQQKYCFKYFVISYCWLSLREGNFLNLQTLLHFLYPIWSFLERKKLSTRMEKKPIFFFSSEFFTFCIFQISHILFLFMRRKGYLLRFPPKWNKFGSNVHLGHNKHFKNLTHIFCLLRDHF